MSTSGDGDKAPQSGLVDMGDIAFYNGNSPITFTIADLANYPGSFSEIVLNVTWAQLQSAAGGPLDTTFIDNAISAINAYNAANGTNVGIKLRVWGGFVAPDWAKNIDGPPITITGQHSVDPIFTPQTIGRFWTADYIAAWTSLQNQLAAAYDNNPVIRGISQTAGASATDEPFIPLKGDALLAPPPSTATVNQVAELQAGGYTNAAQQLTLRAAIADYSQWSTTPLDYTMNLFHLYDTVGKSSGDPNFTLAVLQQAQNSTRLVQAGNHALNSPLPGADSFVYAQIAAYAALDPAMAPASYQTASPKNLGSFGNWPNAVAQGVAADAGDIELWDGPGTTGFTGLPPSQVQALAATLAAGTPPVTTGAPDDGSALGFIAPAFASGAAGTVAFSGVDALLLASVVPQNSYTVTLTSLKGGTLAVTDFSGIVIGPTSGPTVTFSGTPALVNAALASLTDTLQVGQDIVQIWAADSSGDQAVRTVGVQVSPSAAASDSGPTGGAPPATPAAAAAGILVVGGVQGSTVIPGNLDIGGGAAVSTLLAALAPGAYSTASLTIGGTLEVLNGGAAFFTGSLSAGAVTIDNGGAITGDGTVTAANGGAILNNGTIEAAADLTLGLQQLTVANALAGTGTLIVDAGATLTLGGAVGPQQTVQFAPNSIAQFSNDPYSPSTLVLEHPLGMQGTISGFSFADSLVLDGITATGVSYSGGTLTVDESGGVVLLLSVAFTGSLTGLTPVFNVTGSGAGAQSTISFVAPPSPAIVLPSVAAPATLQGAAGVAVLVPDIVLQTPLPVIPPSDTTVTVRLHADHGLLATGGDNGRPTLTLSGTLDTLGAIEQVLQTLTYTGDGSSTDTITITLTDYAGPSTPATIAVTSGGPSTFNWTAASGSFSDFNNWSGGTTPPGGANVAAFGAGQHTVSGDGAVGEIAVTGTTTLTGQVTAQGLGSTAVIVDSGGALTLAGGALLTAQQQAIVGAAGQGLLTLMGGALALAGPSISTAVANALVIGQSAGSNGTVLNLEAITAEGSVVVGGAGAGTLDLLGVAASVSDGGADIGQSAGGQGSATVNGGYWATSGELAVGDAGTGSLLINGMDNGTTGQATAFNATVGARAESHGSVTLDGGELLVANAAAASSSLAVGVAGTGILTIEDGGDVTVGVALGAVANNNGLLTVGGTAGGSGRVDLGWYGMLLVVGNSAVGGVAGTGEVTVGESAGDTASFATTGTLSIGASGLVTLGGVNATVRASTIDIAAGGVVSGAGTISGDGGGNDTVTLAGIDNDSVIAASGGNLLLYGAVTGTGELAVTAGATLTLQAAVGAGQTLAFSPNARAVLNDARAFTGTIAGFGAGDVLDIAGTDATSAVWSDGVLTLGTALGAIRLFVSGNYGSNAFTVQSDGLGGTNVGGIGDVHMTTFDGLHYDFQATGDFVAVRSTEPANPWLIEIRTAAAPGVTSITTELAAQLGDDRVTFAVGRANPVYVDGAADTTLQVGATQNLADGTLARLSAATYRLTWNTGESVTVAVTGQGGWLDWSVGLGPQDGAGSVQGLLGSDSGQATDFQLPNGSVLPQPLSNDQILGGFADAWRVAPGASLFDDRSAPAASATALLLQYMSAMGDATAGAASHDLNATLQGVVSQSADRLFAAATPSSPFHA